MQSHPVWHVDPKSRHSTRWSSIYSVLHAAATRGIIKEGSKYKHIVYPQDGLRNQTHTIQIIEVQTTQTVISKQTTNVTTLQEMHCNSPPIKVKLVAETTPRHHHPLYPIPVPTTQPRINRGILSGGIWCFASDHQNVQNLLYSLPTVASIIMGSNPSKLV
jgi:hypothetical protein